MGLGMINLELCELGLVRCIGFEPSLSTGTVIATLRQALWVAVEWGWRICVQGGDIYQCFQHQDIEASLVAVHAPDWLIHAVIRE